MFIYCYISIFFFQAKCTFKKKAKKKASNGNILPILKFQENNTKILEVREKQIKKTKYKKNNTIHYNIFIDKYYMYH